MDNLVKLRLTNFSRPLHIWKRGMARKNWVGKRTDQVECCPKKLIQIKDELKSKAHSLGLSLVAITSPRPSSRIDKYKEWLQNNYNGELDYMEREDRVARRENPSMILPGAQAVIMVGMYYWPGSKGFPNLHSVKPESEMNKLRRDGPSRGIISSYAWGRDYHDILEKKLKDLARHLNGIAGGIGRFYVDTGAILERDFAERAGLGFIGKNSLLINPRGGSGFFIGELFSTVALAIDGDEDIGAKGRGAGKPGCGKCTKCRVACPTGAIVEDYVVDARKCISYLTIELKGTIPKELREGMGARIYGCDICQQVCPWNRIDWGKGAKEAGGGYSILFGDVGATVTSPQLVELLEMDEAWFKKQFQNSAIRRIGRDRLARNAAIALGNVGGERDIAVLRRAATEDSSELVRSHARWGLGRVLRRMAKARRETDDCGVNRKTVREREK